MSAPFPLAAPRPAPVMVRRPCGCTSMVVDDQPVQVSWCDGHDPGYAPPGEPAPEPEWCGRCGYRVRPVPAPGHLLQCGGAP